MIEMLKPGNEWCFSQVLDLLHISRDGLPSHHGDRKIGKGEAQESIRWV